MLAVSFINTSSTFDHLPRRFQRIRQPIQIHHRNQHRTCPPGNQQKRSILPPPHSPAGIRKLQQRKHRQRQLQRQHHLTQRQQIIHASIAAKSDDQNRGQNRQQSRYHSPRPG